MSVRLFVTGLAASAVLSVPAAADVASSLSEARSMSESSGLPILLKVGTDWCSACKAFDAATIDETSFGEELEASVVLFKVDAEKGAGVDIARNHRVEAYPTFILTNSEGMTIDRWMGYDGAESFDNEITAALADPTTVQEKLARFRGEPTARDAKKLAEIRMGEGLYAEAVALFRRAGELSGSTDVSIELATFEALSRGAYSKMFTVADVTDQADRVFAHAATTGRDRLRVLGGMYKVSHMPEAKGAFVPYLATAFEQTANDEDAYVQKKRTALKADYLLHVKGEKKAALKAKRASMGEGWDTHPNKLNNFAWWCFENELNLDEAADMARRGIELADAGEMKGNILDTLAEICNLKGDCGDAVDYIRLAVAEVPENAYFQKQLVRFEKLLAAQSTY